MKSYIFCSVIITGVCLFDYAQAHTLAPNVCNDVVALQYCLLNPNTYVALLYPSIKWDLARVRNIFGKYGTVVYEKKIILTDDGPLNILRVAYADERWVGGFQDNFKELKKGRKKRFSKFSHTKLYDVRALLFECESLQKVLACKKEIRKTFTKSKPYPIHINDTHGQTIDMAQVVFQDATINFLNYRRRVQYKKFDGLLEEYKKILAGSGANPSSFCVVKSAVQAAWGLQECSELAFIHQGQEALVQKSYADGTIICANEMPEFQNSKKRDAIIYSPSKHFYYKNMKFAVE